MRLPTQRQFDAYFPTIVRYVGVILIVIYALGAFFGFRPPDSILVAATGMILYKTVKSSNGNGNGNGGK